LHILDKNIGKCYNDIAKTTIGDRAYREDLLNAKTA